MVYSVIVPIYKVEKYLPKCIESILGQTFHDFELILVDDGSPDSCPEICDSYARSDSRVRVIHKKNGGLVSARNTGVQEANGDYICYVDGDDWVSEDLLDTIWKKAISQHNPDITVYSAVRVFNDRESEIPRFLEEGFYNKDRLTKDVYPYMMYDNRKKFCTGLVFPVAWNKIYRRELLCSVLCQDEKIRMGEDNAFVFEALYKADTVFFCDNILYFYNQLNESSMVHSYDPGRFENNQRLTAYIVSRLGGLNCDVDYQINAFKAYWLIMAIFHEVKSERPMNESARHIRDKIKVTDALNGITLSGLPMTAKVYIVLLKLGFFRATWVASYIVNKIRAARQ